MIHVDDTEATRRLEERGYRATPQRLTVPEAMEPHQEHMQLTVPDI